MKNEFYKMAFAMYQTHVVNHGIFTKLSSLIHLYSSFLQFPNNISRSYQWIQLKASYEMSFTSYIW